MKTLADLKRVLKQKGVQVASKVYDYKGELVKEGSFVEVSQVLTTCFALKRSNGESWVAFLKARDWTFTENTATYNWASGAKLVLEIKR